MYQDYNDLRTFNDNAQCYLRSFFGKNEIDYGCIDCPIMWTSNEQSTFVIGLFVIPTLHIKLGIANKVYKDLRNKFTNRRMAI